MNNRKKALFNSRFEMAVRILLLLDIANEHLSATLR